MKQKINISICLTLLIILVSIITAEDTHATVRLFDGNLILNGYVKEVMFYRTAQKQRDEKYHDSKVDFLKTSAGIEALYKINEDEDYTFEFFTGMKGWYEASMALDDTFRDSFTRQAKSDYVYPKSFDDDVLNEAYFDLVTGPFQIRVGKQVVVWGSLDVDQVADVVNALDFRHSIFGVDKWEEFKRGAWMVRLFYQSELPGNLRFEVIFNPGDFKRNLFPFAEGLHYGADAYEKDPPVPSQVLGFGGYLGEKMGRDAPSWNIKNYELGFKVSGYTWNWDWSLIYYDHINKAPVVDGYQMLRTEADSGKDGYGTIYWNSLFTGIDPADTEWWNYDERVFIYKRSQIVGGTLERELLKGGPVFRGGILTFEWFYELGTPLNTAGTSDDNWGNPAFINDPRLPGGIDGQKRKDIVGGAVKFYQKIYIPGFTNSFIATGKRFEYTLTYFMEKVINHDRSLVLNQRFHKYDESTASSISFFAIQQMFNFSWAFVFNSYYKPRIDKWFVAPSVQYTFPGSHWYALVGFIKQGGARPDNYTNNYYESKDSILLQLRYEF
jgi:hypothetical protein